MFTLTRPGHIAAAGLSGAILNQTVPRVLNGHTTIA
jgi:hypothetical protein